MAIIGNIYNLKKHLSEKKLDLVFEYFLNALDPKHGIHKRIFNLKEGSFERIDLTEDIFALEQVFITKDREECFIESHKKYIDFQLVLSGNEQMEYVDIEKLEIASAYNIEKDLTTYKLVSNTSKFLLQKEDLAIFFPEDGHIGLPKFEKSELVYKTVIKLPIDLFKESK